MNVTAALKRDMSTASGLSCPVSGVMNYATTHVRNVSGRGLRSEAQGPRLLRGALPASFARCADQSRHQNAGSQSTVRMHGARLSRRCGREGFVQDALRPAATPRPHEISGSKEASENLCRSKLRQSCLCEGLVSFALAASAQAPGEVRHIRGTICRDACGAGRSLRGLSQREDPRKLAIRQTKCTGDRSRSQNEESARPALRQMQSRHRHVAGRPDDTGSRCCLPKKPQTTSVGPAVWRAPQERAR